MLGQVASSINLTPTASIRRVEMSLSAGDWNATCVHWVQAAVLGSPEVERATRFEVWKGDKMLLDWSRCLSCFLLAGFDHAKDNNFTPWVSKIIEIAQLEQVSKTAPKVGRSRVRAL